MGTRRASHGLQFGRSKGESMSLGCVDSEESTLARVAEHLLEEKIREVQHTIELGNGERVKFTIRHLKKRK